MTPARVTTYVLVWLGLMALLSATLASAFIALGPLNSMINLAISCAKGLLVAWFYMHLRRENGVVRLMAITGLVWFVILIVLTESDYATRAPSPAPWAAVSAPQ